MYLLFLFFETSNAKKYSLLWTLSLSFPVVAIELLAACQALEFHRPKKTTAPLEEVYKIVRSVVPDLSKDRFLAPDMEAVTEILQDGKVSLVHEEW